MERQSRRTFLKDSGMVLLGAGMAASTIGCAALTTFETTPQDGRVTVDTATFKELAVVGGAIQVSVSRGGDPVLLIRTGPNGFQALSPICTHLGCQVRKTRYALRCPCHGSVYDFDGRVTEGPAKESLTVYPVELSGTTVTIRIG